MATMDKQQLNQNTQDIQKIKNDIDTIKSNHLHHIEKDMNKLEKRVGNIDSRLWAILFFVVATMLTTMLKGVI